MALERSGKPTRASPMESKPPSLRASKDATITTPVLAGVKTSSRRERQVALLPAKGRVNQGKASLQHARVLKRWPTRLGRTSSRGLRNASNWCYRNSTYQALLHCPEVVNFLNSCSEQCVNGFQLCSICGLRRLSFAYWAKGNYFGPKLDMMNSTLSSTFENMTFEQAWAEESTQQDAAEFLDYLLRVLKQDAAMHENAGDILDTLFHSTLEIQRTCSECGQVRIEQDEVEMIRCASAANKDEQVSLTQCLEEYFNEQLQDVRCSNNNCKAASNSVGGGIEQTKRFTDVPDILVIRIPVEVMAESGKSPSKRMKPCAYDAHLDLKRYYKLDQPLHYTLQAVVGHIGRSLLSGHYITVNKEPDATYSTTSDDIVYHCTRPKIGAKRLLSPVDVASKNQVQPYMLLYTRDEEENQEEEGEGEGAGVESSVARQAGSANSIYQTGVAL